MARSKKLAKGFIDPHNMLEARRIVNTTTQKLVLVKTCLNGANDLQVSLTIFASQTSYRGIGDHEYSYIWLQTIITIAKKTVWKKGPILD